jgi:hypothetical protein
MIAISIAGATRRIGKAQGYKGLSVLDRVNDAGQPYMITAWEPTPAEIARIAAGAPIYLHILGTGHPPVMLEVGEPQP